MPLTCNAVLAIAVLATAQPAFAQEAAPDGFAGTWVYDAARSGPHRDITETVIMSRTGDIVRYSADVTFAGQRSGGRFEAHTDGRPAPLYDLLTGRKVGTATLTRHSARVETIRMVPDEAGRAAASIEHWLSTDGQSFTSLLKAPDGAVSSVLVFRRAR